MKFLSSSAILSLLVSVALLQSTLADPTNQAPASAVGGRAVPNPSRGVPRPGKPEQPVEPVHGKPEPVNSVHGEPVNSVHGEPGKPVKPTHVKSHTKPTHVKPKSHPKRDLEERAEPVNGKPEPVNGKPEPVNGKPEPVNGKPEPVNGKPEPVKPTHVKPHPKPTHVKPHLKPNPKRSLKNGADPARGKRHPKPIHTEPTHSKPAHPKSTPAKPVQL